MKKLIILLSIFSSLIVQSQELEVMTFNIRYDNVNDGEDRWSERKESVAQLIKFYRPQVIGIQEALESQIEYLDSASSDYTYVGVGRDDGQTKGEFSPILYDSTLLTLRDQGTFWLSPTPDEVSVGWDAALPRVCTYALLERKSDQKLFWVFNTHFDHIGEQARLNSAALIVRMSKQFNISEAPMFIMGDLNSKPEDGPIKLLNNNVKDARVNSMSTYGPEGTFFGFDLSAQALDRIDYIFGKGLTFNQYQVIDDRRPNNRHVSDHLPVLISVSLN